MDQAYNADKTDKVEELLYGNSDKANATSNEFDSTRNTSFANLALPPESDLKSGSLPIQVNNDTKYQRIEMTETKDTYSDISSLSSHSSSDNENESAKQREKKAKLKEVLKETKRKVQDMEKDLREEIDAKERVELQLSLLQSKYQEQLNKEESLRSTLSHNHDYCRNLEQKLISLGQQLPIKTTEDYDPNDESALGGRLTSSEVLIQTYIDQAENLDKDTSDLKRLEAKVFELQQQIKDLEEQNNLKTQQLKSQGLQSMTYSHLGNGEEEHRKEVHNRIKMMENNLDELQIKIETLEDENSTLQKQVHEEQEKFKTVLDSNQKTHDAIVENLNKERAALQDRVRIAEDNNNETLMKSLRQDILDVQLTNERLKKAHRDEMETLTKRLNEMLKLAEQSQVEKSEKDEQLADLKSQLTSSEDLSNERMKKVIALNTEIADLNEAIKLSKQRLSTKEDEISDLAIKLDAANSMLNKMHEEKKQLKEEVADVNEVRENNKRLHDEIQDTKQQIKIKRMKVKFLKKQIKELNEQKTKAESILFVLPEMQKKIDQLENEKLILQNEIKSLRQQEVDRVEKLEQAKKYEEERILKQKEEWERYILGIGKCELCHEESNSNCDSIVRPNSAPLMKPRPPSSRQYHSGSGQRKPFAKAPTLNPLFVNSYPEGRKVSERIKDHQSRIIISSKNTKNLFRSATEPSPKLIKSFGHSSGNKHFPKISKDLTKKRSTSPRVLVWGESNDGPGKKLVAVGDYVLARIQRDCSLHGQSANEYTGYIKFIGFIEGNVDDVYIGLRLVEEVGNTDGRVNGRLYFRCEPQKGKFVHLDDIVQVLQ